MFARILRCSITPFLYPTRLMPSLKTLPKLYKAPIISTRPQYTFSTSSQSQSNPHQARAQEIMSAFLKRENLTPTEILKTLSNLENAKQGIRSTDILYKEFMLRLNDAVRGNLSGEVLEAIALKAYSLNIKDPLFWFSLDNTAKSGGSENIDFQTLLVLSSILLRVKSYPQFLRYISGMKADLLEAVKKNVSQFSFRDVIHASYIFGSLDTQVPELTKRLKNELKSSLKNPNSVDVSINELATTAVLVFSLVKEESEKVSLLKDLGNFLASQDLNRFLEKPGKQVTDLDYEERITWQSVAFLVRTYYSAQYRNEGLVGKLNDLIVKKIESDPVDFESSSILLSVLTNDTGSNSKIILSVLESVHNQLVNEGTTIFTQFDGRNVSAFLRSVITLGKKGTDPELMGEFVEYFMGLVMSDKVATKIEVEDYRLLGKLFEEAKGIANVDQKVFGHIQKRIDYITAQQKREQSAQS